MKQLKSFAGILVSVFVLSLFLYSSEKVFAAPSVSSISGTWNHKSSITINGSGFGAKSTAAPVIWDDASGSDLLSRGWSGVMPNQANSPLYYAAYRSPQRGISLPHNNITKYIAGAHAGNGGYYGGYNVGVWKARDITSFPVYYYLSWYQRADDNWTWLGGGTNINYKTFQWGYGDDFMGSPEWYLGLSGLSSRISGAQMGMNDNTGGGFGTIQNPDNNGNDTWWVSTINPMSGQWVKAEVEMKITNQSDGFVNLWENGVKIVYYSGRTDNFGSLSTPRSVSIGGYTDNMGTNNWRYFADIYLDYSLARVVIANNSNIANATIIEPQIPSAWSANSITLSSNLGKFTSGQTAYLFVYDSTGTPNVTGYPVTIGSSGGGDTQAPTWPTGTTFSANATSSSSITVTWSAATDNVGVANYLVERCQGSGCTNFTQVGTPSASPFIDSGLTANTFYNYHVRATDAAGNLSGWSNVVGATTQSSSFGSVARNECANPPSGAVLCEDFENSNWRTSWGSSSFSEITDVTTPGPSQDAANKAIQFLPAAGVSNNTSTYKSFAPAQKMWVRWYTKYNTGFSFSDQNHGGGFSAGNINLIGSSGNRPAGDSTGFASFWTEYNDGNGKFRNYSYYHGMYQDCPGPGSCYGDSLPCVYDTGGTYCTKPQDRPIGGIAAVPSVAANQWYCIEQYVDVGDPISDAQAVQGLANGEFRSYIDGVLVGQIPNLHMRTSSSFQGSSEIFLQLYFHQATHNNAGQVFDNIVVSPNRVGCGATTPDITAPALLNPLPTGTVNSPVSLSVTSNQSCSAVWSDLIRPFDYSANQTTFTTTGGTSHSGSAPFSTGAHTLYYQCKDSAGNISNMINANFSIGTGSDTTPPTSPTNLAATSPSQSSISVSWTASTDNVGVTGYIVERCQGTGCSNFTQVGTPTASPFVDSGLTANTFYNYHVRAADAAGNLSGWSNVVGATTQVQSATSTMGETNILSLGDSGNGSLLLAQQTTLSQAGTLQSLSFYVTTAAGNLRLGVYDATGPSGGPGALKAQTNSFVPTTGWNTQNVTTPVPLTAGTYWLAYLPSSSSLAFVRDGTGSFRYYSYTFGPMPATFSTTPTSGTDHWSFYATLTSGGGTFTSCNTVTTSNFSQSAYNSYGAPFDAFQTGTNLINAACSSADTHTIQTTLGQTGDTTRIVYTKGYYYTGSAWTQYTGTCTGAQNGDWCQGSVSATITNPNLSTASASAPAYFVGMTCSVQSGGWKCGCRDTTCGNFYWMIQGAGQ